MAAPNTHNAADTGEQVAGYARDGSEPAHNAESLFDAATFSASTADISDCGRYRYTLTRRWTAGDRIVVWVMLNPSTADAAQDDPTIRRCIGFSKREDADGLCVVNLFAWRATDPRELSKVADPIGPRNDDAILEAAAGAWRIVGAWGENGARKKRGVAVAALLARHGHDVYRLGSWTTASGHPRHPLYLPRDEPLYPHAIHERKAIA